MIEKFLNELLSQFGAGSKESVYLSVTPGVGLELIQVDPSIKTIKNYGHKPLDYSDSMREIVNYDDFKSALEDLFSELNISPKCNIVLNIPMAHFGKIDLPLLLDDDGITEAIVSEVEQAYIFKRCEPVVSWYDASVNNASDTRTIFYAALQKPAIDKIKNIVSEIGATLTGIEISLISSLRALLYSDVTAQVMENGSAWNLMTISSNGYSILSLAGKNIVDYYEEPLALKTYELDEIYDAINASAQIALMHSPSNYLYVVSETDLVSAEHLVSKMQFEGTVNALENNSFKRRELLPVSLNILPDQVAKISLEAIGVAVSRICNYPVKFDFLFGKSGEAISTDSVESLSFHFNDKEIVLTEDVMRKMSYAIAGILLVPALVAFFTLPVLQKKYSERLQDINAKINSVDSQISQLTEQASASGSFVVKTEIENVLKANRIKLISYSALGESVPNDLWISYFSVKEDGKIDIKGESQTVEAIYVFFKNMKDYLIDTRLRVYKLKMKSDSIEDAVSLGEPQLYEFEITNMSEAELTPTVDKVTQDPNNKKDAQKNASAQNPPAENPVNAKPPNSTKKVNDLEPIEVD